METTWDLIVLDLDGTLADTSPDIQFSLNQALKEKELSPYTVEEVVTFIGNGAKVLVQKALFGRWSLLLSSGRVEGEINSWQDVPDALTNEFYKRLLKYYNASKNEYSKLYPGVAHFIKNTQIPLAILTNKPEIPTHSFIRDFGLKGCFQMVLSGDSAPAKKPNPQGLLSIMEKVGASAARTVMVGDGVPDVKVAKAAGVKSIALLQGFGDNDALKNLNPDWLRNSFKDILELL